MGNCFLYLRWEPITHLTLWLSGWSCQISTLCGRWCGISGRAAVCVPAVCTHIPSSYDCTRLLDGPLPSSSGTRSHGFPRPQRHLLHPRELRPAACCRHLWVGLHRGHPRLLWHLHLRVWHCHQWDHDVRSATQSTPRYGCDHGPEGSGLDTKWGSQRPQVPGREQHIYTSQLYTREHSHVVALQPRVWNVTAYVPGDRKTRGQRRGNLISLTTEPTPGYPICYTFFFFTSLLARGSAVKRPVPFSVVILDGWMYRASLSTVNKLVFQESCWFGQYINRIRCLLNEGFYNCITGVSVAKKKSSLNQQSSAHRHSFMNYPMLCAAHLFWPFAYFCTAHFLNDRIIIYGWVLPLHSE